MQTSVTWTSPLTWLIALALLALLVVQLWFIIRSPAISSSRKWVRAGLNGLLWLLLVAYFLELRWPITRPASHALLVGNEVPASFARQLSDSLHIQQRFTSRNFKTNYDSITLVGQQFPVETLTQLSQSALQWIPYNQSDQLQDVRWKGIVRQGERQSVTGSIYASKAQMLRVQYGRKTLDSVALHEGDNTFALHFPAFSNGRTQAELTLGQSGRRGNAQANTVLDTLRFFTRSTRPLTVQFLLNNPDFESKTLADWLGKQGHTVELSATLSKNLGSQVSINRVGKAASKATPDIIITEPINAANATVRKAIADGKAVLFINLTNAETNCRIINQALGSHWQVRKTTNEPLVALGNGLNALPYQFTDNLNQFAVSSGYPIAIQRTAGRVGVSLLSETYPLALSGDSITYNRIWTATLARLSASASNTVRTDAPVYKGIQQMVMVNNPINRLMALRIGQDTVRLSYSPLNDRSAGGTSSFGRTGWQTVQDTLALYVNSLKSTDPIADRKTIRQFILAHVQFQPTSTKPDDIMTEQVPEWVWMLALIACFTALWVEPKL